MNPYLKFMTMHNDTPKMPKKQTTRKNCPDCNKEFSMNTLNKYSGRCGRCAKRILTSNGVL